MLSAIKEALVGSITNWKSYGGRDAPIKIILVGGGGGVTTAVEAALLGGQPASNPQVIYVRSPVQLVQIVEQEPFAMGFAQLALLKQRGLPELATDKPIEQVLSLVTMGAPTPEAASVINAARQIANLPTN